MVYHAICSSHKIFISMFLLFHALDDRKNRQIAVHEACIGKATQLPYGYIHVHVALSAKRFEDERFSVFWCFMKAQTTLAVTFAF